ncbi:hypothetical protein E6C70_14760 [Glaciibacter flavus]|uniref:Uncharacterized protein n=1 Tax=Orlajensenia flava TaxID=2565934 RepID=A0A4S4FKE2_9MICO|nr:pectin acetylesterase-family hydrolase [Glaciibacter flavus]THG30358.1 hypothetical protein E6C70_15040 [Glaciibacter flavus]THG30621.1 hypothetical protein E6C70_14760 [Glaciibacter flavus]
MNRKSTWIALAGCIAVVVFLVLNPLATLGTIGGALLLGVAFVYFIHFRHPSGVMSLNEVSDRRWHSVDLGKTTISGDGTRYEIYVRRGASSNLIIHFSGGGACWDDITASQPITLRRVLRGYTRDLRAFYFTALTKLFPTALTGMANQRDKDNRFRDWNFVFIPYTTGDLHVGDVVNTYAGKKGPFQVHHNGRNNTTAALAWIFANFLEPEKVMVSGESSEAWASAFYAPLVADHYTGKRVYCLSDGAGILSPRWSDVFDRTWRADSATYLGFQIGTDVYEDALSHRIDRVGGDIRYLHSNTLYDDTLTRFSAALNNVPTDTDRFIDDWSAHTVETMKRLAGDPDLAYQHFLTDWGHNVRRHTTAHTITTNELFHKAEADGVTYAEWLARNVIDDEDLSLGGRLLP